MFYKICRNTCNIIKSTKKREKCILFHFPAHIRFLNILFNFQFNFRMEHNFFQNFQNTESTQFTEKFNFVPKWLIFLKQIYLKKTY